MEALIRVLIEKMEKLEATQQLILNKLNDTIIYQKPQFIPSPNDKKAEERERIEEYTAAIIHGPLLREKFNIAVTPQMHRIRAYFKIGDPSAFDGLKRNE